MGLQFGTDVLIQRVIIGLAVEFIVEVGKFVVGHGLLRFGVFLFDMNTPYKHRNVLGDNEFTFEEEDAACVWRNHYDAVNRRVEITVDIDYHETGEHFHEQFYEYTYDLDTIRTALEKHGFALESVCDGETFGPLTTESQRYFFCAVKQYTQLEE